MRYLVAWIALGSALPAYGVEIWLASSEQCNSCALYERAAQRHGYGRTLTYSDRGGMTIPILRVGKNVLAADVLAQLPPGEGPDSPSWDVTLTVLVMDVDRVLFAGNIAESADNRELREPRGVMFPPAVPGAGDPSVAPPDLYADFFVTHWNLEYFVDVALGKQPRRRAEPLVNLTSPEPASLAARNVVLWGSARTPLENSLFIPTRLSEVRAAIDGLGIAPPRVVTLFGHGPGVEGNDTSRLVDGHTEFERADVRADLGADAESLNRVLKAVRHADGTRTLLVQVGHSGPTGSPRWGHGLTLTPEDLAPIAREAAGELVMVSGACHSGMFAKAVQCGFFAAHPDVIAAGCQRSQQALESSDDYLRLFFRNATTPAGPGKRVRGRAPKPPSMHDAHWAAAAQLEDQELAYTTTDALIDDYFAAHSDLLPASFTVGELRGLASMLPAAEADALATMTGGLAAEMAVPLRGYVAANHAAVEKLAGATERSSAERNQIVALPYKLMLPVLARRIAYAQLGVDDAAYALAESCEQRSLTQFLGAD